MYDQLLGARGAAPHAEALQAPILRLRLLRSLLYLVHLAAVRFVSFAFKCVCCLHSHVRHYDAAQPAIIDVTQSIRPGIVPTTSTLSPEIF